MNNKVKELLLSNELLLNVYHNQNLEGLSNEELIITLEELRESLSDSKPHTIGRHAHGVLCQLLPLIKPKVKDIEDVTQYFDNIGVIHNLEYKIDNIIDLSHGIEDNRQVYFIARTQFNYISGPLIRYNLIRYFKESGNFININDYNTIDRAIEILTQRKNNILNRSY